MSSSRLVEVMRQAARQTNPSSEITDMMYASVLTVNPLKIKIDNRFEIDEDFLVVSAMCIKKTLTIPQQTINFTSHSESHSVTIPAGEYEIWRDLQVGDTVKVLRCSKGQAYYILERVGEL